MVRFVNVSQNYGSFIALRDLTFNVKEKSLLALLGPNGAGKSTTMSIMTGFRPPLEGDVFINNINIFEEPEKAKSYIGYLAEIPPVYPELTVSEYLNFIGEFRGLSEKDAKFRCQEVLELLNLRDRQDALIKNLSKGLRQRVGIAQSIVHKPKLLVLDEPTVGLEPSQLIEFRQIVKYFVQDMGMTVVISTHIMSEASEICDDVIILNEGKKIFDGSKEELLAKNNNSYTYEITLAIQDEKILNYLKNIDYVDTVYFEKEKLIVSTKYDASEKIVSDIVSFGVGIKSFTPVVDSLEKVFLNLTN